MRDHQILNYKYYVDRQTGAVTLNFRSPSSTKNFLKSSNYISYCALLIAETLRIDNWTFPKLGLVGLEFPDEKKSCMLHNSRRKLLCGTHRLE